MAIFFLIFPVFVLTKNDTISFLEKLGCGVEAMTVCVTCLSPTTTSFLIRYIPLWIPPNRSRQMATLPELGFARGFCHHRLQLA